MKNVVAQNIIYIFQKFGSKDCLELQLLQLSQQEMHTEGNLTHNDSVNNIVEPSEPQLLTEHTQTINTLAMFIKPMIFSGIDGCINTLTIVSACVALGLSVENIQFYCFALLIADGISMGLGDYLSTKAQINFTGSKEEQALYQFQHNLDDEKKSLIGIYEGKDFNLQNATRIIQLYSTNQQAFLNIQLLEQYKLVKIDKSMAIKNGLASLISFLVCGFIPAIPYMISKGALGEWKNWDKHWIIVLSIGGIQLFSLGFFKGALLGANKLQSAFKTSLLGGFVFASSYFLIVYLLDKY